MNVQKEFYLDNYVVIRNVVAHGLLTDDGAAFPASPEMQAGRLNVWSCAVQAKGARAGDGKYSRWSVAV
ncbi:hypothetical protein [Paraburkholderia aromaticivorans]|uniref:hypothetical protein n=1 Tax=Paraburkholderia aromaticivorans TaxID=2026199 RepID=UPI001455F206|nr:hypothetical protein [Paraburkholderia aromaticivorans]